MLTVQQRLVFICGLYWAVSSNMTVEATQRLTGGGGFAIGHQQQFANLVCR